MNQLLSTHSRGLDVIAVQGAVVQRRLGGEAGERRPFSLGRRRTPLQGNSAIYRFQSLSVPPAAQDEEQKMKLPDALVNDKMFQLVLPWDGPQDDIYNTGDATGEGIKSSASTGTRALLSHSPRPTTTDALFPLAAFRHESSSSPGQQISAQSQRCVLGPWRPLACYRWRSRRRPDKCPATR